MSDDVMVGKSEFSDPAWKPGSPPTADSYFGALSAAQVQAHATRMEAHFERLAGELGRAENDLQLSHAREAKLRDLGRRLLAAIEQERHGGTMGEAMEGLMAEMDAAALLAEPVPGEPAETRAPEDSAAGGFMGHWTATHDISRGVKIWLDGRPMFACIAGLADSKVSDEDREATWRKCVTELLRRMNASDGGAAALLAEEVPGEAAAPPLGDPDFPPCPDCGGSMDICAGEPSGGPGSAHGPEIPAAARCPNCGTERPLTPAEEEELYAEDDREPLLDWAGIYAAEPASPPAAPEPEGAEARSPAVERGLGYFKGRLKGFDGELRARAEAERWRALAGRQAEWIDRRAADGDPIRSVDGTAAMAEWTALREEAAMAEEYGRRLAGVRVALETVYPDADVIDVDFAEMAAAEIVALREQARQDEALAALQRVRLEGLELQIGALRERAERAERVLGFENHEQAAALRAAGAALQPFADLADKEAPADDAGLSLLHVQEQCLQAAKAAASLPALRRAMAEAEGPREAPAAG